LREFGGLKGYFVNLSKLGIGEIVRLTPSILNQLKFKGIGQTTIFHLLKNMGIDIFKPDIHVCRILDRLGLIADGASIYEVCEAMRSLALSYNIKVSELDTLFFVYGKTNADFIPLNSFL
jgi:thermostable 8-oxoguanine DNA glycosylase